MQCHAMQAEIRGVQTHDVTMLVEKMIIKRLRVPSAVVMPQMSRSGAMMSSKSASTSAERYQQKPMT